VNLLAGSYRCDLTERDFSDCAIPYAYFYKRDLSGCNFLWGIFYLIVSKNLKNNNEFIDICKFFLNLKYGFYGSKFN
jgi:hypothetical protein